MSQSEEDILKTLLGHELMPGKLIPPWPRMELHVSQARLWQAANKLQERGLVKLEQHERNPIARMWVSLLFPHQPAS